MSLTSTPDRSEEDDLFSAEDTAILDETKRLRLSLIRQLAQGGKLPDDKSDKITLSQLMNDVDGQIIARKRTKIAAKTEENMGNMASVIAQALKKHRVGGNPTDTPPCRDLPPEISAGEIVPGETDQGVLNVTMKDLGID